MLQGSQQGKEDGTCWRTCPESMFPASVNDSSSLWSWVSLQLVPAEGWGHRHRGRCTFHLTCSLPLRFKAQVSFPFLFFLTQVRALMAIEALALLVLVQFMSHPPHFTANRAADADALRKGIRRRIRTSETVSSHINSRLCAHWFVLVGSLVCTGFYTLGLWL